MENKLKTNPLSVVSFISGIFVIASLGLFYSLSHFLLMNDDVLSFEIFNRFLHVLLAFSVPVRNIFAPLAVLTGFFGLREIKRNEIAQKGTTLAWIGILLGGGWVILGIVVSIVFLLAKML